MFKPFQSVRDLTAGAEVLRRRRYGVIETADDRLVAVHLRPWPKHVSIAEIVTLGRWRHRGAAGNRCLLYYNEPRSCPGFLSLIYVVSQRDTTLKTALGALDVLDEIARLKQTDAIVAEIGNFRISDRSMFRQGWERHCLDSSGRHFIKRFYGEYPAPRISQSSAPMGVRETSELVCK